MVDKNTIIYKGHKLYFWGGSWDVYDKEWNYVIKCFRYLEDAKKYVDEIEETLDNE